MKDLKIALAHDSFTSAQLGGAERVVDALHELFPEAPVFTLVLDKKVEEKYKNWDIRTSWLQYFYNFIPSLQYLLPFIPFAVKALNFKGYDVVISSSSGFVKNINVPKNIKHICYCHTPTRFVWVDKTYVDQETPSVLKPFVKVFLRYWKGWDFKKSQKINFFIANSKEVQKRIQTYYNRESEVVYPPVDTDFWKNTGAKQNYFLLAGRLQAHKNNEFIIQVFNDLGLHLHVVGTGRQESYLRSIAGSNIKFYGRLEDQELRDQYSGALAYIYPQTEDFGLMPLEAALCGTPTLAYGYGGALETVVPGVTGEFFKAYNKEEVKKIISSWDFNKYNPKVLKEHAENFSKENFKKGLVGILEKHINENSR